MTDIDTMTTEELTVQIERMVRLFEDTTNKSVKVVLISTIERLETVRDNKSWN